MKLSFLFGDRTIEQAASKSKALSMHVCCLICARCSMEFFIKIRAGRNEESITHLKTHYLSVTAPLSIIKSSANAHIFSNTFSQGKENLRLNHHVTKIKFLTSFF